MSRGISEFLFENSGDIATIADCITKAFENLYTEHQSVFQAVLNAVLNSIKI